MVLLYLCFDGTVFQLYPLCKVSARVFFLTEYVAKCSIVWHLWALSCYVLSCNMWCTELCFVCQFEFMTWKKNVRRGFRNKFQGQISSLKTLWWPMHFRFWELYVKIIISAVLYQLRLYNTETNHHSSNFIIDISVQITLERQFCGLVLDYFFHQNGSEFKIKWMNTYMLKCIQNITSLAPHPFKIKK